VRDKKVPQSTREKELSHGKEKGRPRHKKNLGGGCRAKKKKRGKKRCTDKGKKKLFSGRWVAGSSDA